MDQYVNTQLTLKLPMVSL